MKLFPLETGFFSTDGGAMFGIVPKKVWSARYFTDEANRCPLTMRALFVDFGQRKVLFDAGVGTIRVQGMAYYKFHNLSDITLLLNSKGIDPEEITDVVLSHLHFDHCGGTVRAKTDGSLSPVFPNAAYWVGKKQLERASNTSVWETGSYAPAVVAVLKQTGKLNVIEQDTNLFPGLSVSLYQGHTEDQLVSTIEQDGKTVVFCGDVIPMVLHVTPLCVSAVDNAAETSVDEKMRLLKEAVKRDAVLVFYHDVKTQAATLKEVAGKISVHEVVRF